MNCCPIGTHKCDVKINRHKNKWNNFFYVDKCIADIIQALNDGGIKTVASCCGHGKQEGTIYLRNNMKLRINRLGILKNKS